MKRYLDQDPDSNYMFFKCDLTKGACDRETAAQLFKELFNDKLGLESSYTRDEGLSPLEAARKELLPADNDRHYRNFFEEQMEALRQMMNAERAERDEDAWEKEHGFRRDDPDIIDVGDEPARAPGNAVGAAAQTGLAMPKPIIYGVDLHIPAGGALGYDGGGRLGHDRRRGGRYLREAEAGTPVSDIVDAFKGLPDGLKKDAEQVACSGGAVVVKHKGGKFTVVEGGKVSMEKVSAEELKKSGKLGKKQVTVVNRDELDKMLSECDSDPEKMMKEFVELGQSERMSDDLIEDPNGEDAELADAGYDDKGVPEYNGSRLGYGRAQVGDRKFQEDEIRRPKDRPHNLHMVDEFDDEAGLNESMIRFCDRLIRG